MLNSNSFGGQRVPVEKSVDARILKPIFVGGQARKIGDVCQMTLSDAQALQNSSPPTVELIKP